LRGRHDVVVYLGGEDRIEPCFFRFARDRLDFFGTPTNAGNDAECKSFRRGSLLFYYRFNSS